jgi:predicted aspartyl protease
MKFAYIEHLGFSQERLFRPLIPVKFVVNGHEFVWHSLIDSGADYIVLPISVASRLGLNLDLALSFRVQAAGNQILTLYKSPIEIEIILEKGNSRPIKLSSHVYFSESESAVLLGQKGFLDRLKVTLNGKKREVEIKRQILC